MALSTYTSIIDSIVDYLNRDGFSQVSDKADEFFEIGQRRVNRLVRVPAMERVITLNVNSAGRAALPNDFVDVKYLIVDDNVSAWHLTRGSFHEVKKLQVSASTQRPQVFDLEADSIYIGSAPQSGQTITLVYYRELPVLSTDNDENWFSTDAPELLLFAALVEAAVFMKDADLEDFYEEHFQMKLKELMAERKRSEHSGSPLAVRTV